MNLGTLNFVYMFDGCKGVKTSPFLRAWVENDNPILTFNSNANTTQLQRKYVTYFLSFCKSKSDFSLLLNLKVLLYSENIHLEGRVFQTFH